MSSSHVNAASARNPGWWVAGICFLMAVVAWGAVFYGHSVYMAALQQSHGWSASLIASAILVFWFSSIPGTLLVGQLSDRRGAAPVVLIGAVTIGTGCLLLGRVDAPWQLYLVYALMGLGYPAIGIAGISAALAPWFDRQFGFALGLALTGASVGGALLPPAVVSVTSESGFATATLLLGSAILALLLPAAWWLTRFDGHRPTAHGRGGAASAKSLPRREILRRAMFWRIAIAGGLGLGAQVGFLAHQVPMLATTLGQNGAALSVTVVALSAAAGRLVIGYLSHRVSEAALSVACYLTQAAGFVILALADGAVALYVGCAVAGFVVGAITMLPPMLVRQGFGADGYGRNYAMVNVVLYLGAGLGPWFAGLLRDFTGNYVAALGLLAAMHLVAAAILAVPGKRQV